MHVSTHSTNLNFSVPVTSNAQRQLQPVLECRDQSQHSNQANCDTEDEVNKSLFLIYLILLMIVEVMHAIDQTRHLFRVTIKNGCIKEIIE